MKDLTTKKLLAQEERQLSAWLNAQSNQDTLNLMELKGFLFGVCTAPSLVMPSVWLAHILGGELLDLEGAESVENLELIMRLYNYTANQVVENKIKLPFKPLLDANNISHNFQRGNPLCDWSFGVDFALQLTMDKWNEVELAEEEDDFFNMCWMCFTLFADEQRTRKQLKHYAKSEKKFIEAVSEIFGDFPAIFRDYTKACRSLYLENMDNSMSGFVEEPHRQSDLFPEEFEGEKTHTESLFDLALQAPTRSEAIHLAKQALKLDPNNIDIYRFIGDCYLGVPKEVVHWFEQAVAAGERALGENYFQENLGHFWGLRETRPYMEALCSLGDAYYEAGRMVQSISCYEKCLYLNPNDNQGVRDLLMGVYIENHHIEKANALMKTYEDDRSAFMRYSQVLIAYITEGDSENSRALKLDAKNYNKYVSFFLNGKHKMPKNMPEYFGLGDKNEAIIYVSEHKNVWRKTMGAIGWLVK